MEAEINKYQRENGSYLDRFEHSGDTSLGEQDVVEDGWNPTSSDYLSGGNNISRASNTSHFFNTRGMSTTLRHPRSLYHIFPLHSSHHSPFLNACGTSTMRKHPWPSLSHLSTSFVLEPAAEDGTIGSEYHFPGLSTLDQRPSSIYPKERGKELRLS